MSDPRTSGADRPPDGPVLRAVRSQLKRLRVPRDEAPALWELALQLAARADVSTSARDLPGLSRELRNTLDELAAAQPEEAEEADPLDDLAARRAGRRATA